MPSAHQASRIARDWSFRYKNHSCPRIELLHNRCRWTGNHYFFSSLFGLPLKSRSLFTNLYWFFTRFYDIRRRKNGPFHCRKRRATPRTPYRTFFTQNFLPTHERRRVPLLRGVQRRCDNILFVQLISYPLAAEVIFEAIFDLSQNFIHV